MLKVSAPPKRPLTQAERNAANRLYRIWHERKDSRGLTQKKAAKLMSFSSQTTISMYIHGHMPLGTNAVIKFAKLLGVEPEEIFPELGDRFKALAGAIAKSGPEKLEITQEEVKWLSLFRNLLSEEKKVFMETLRCITANRADTRVTATHCSASPIPPSHPA